MNTTNDLKAVRTRLILAVVVLNLATFTVFGGAVLWWTFHDVGNVLQDESMNRLLIMAEGLGRRAAAPLKAGDTESVRQVLQEAMAQPDIAYSFIRNADGSIAISTFENNIVPEELKNVNQMGRGVPFATQETRIVSGDMVLQIVDVGAALAEGSQGSLHVGWLLDILRSGLQTIFLRLIVYAASLSIILVIALVLLSTALTGRILRSVESRSHRDGS